MATLNHGPKGCHPGVLSGEETIIKGLAQIEMKEHVVNHKIKLMITAW